MFHLLICVIILFFLFSLANQPIQTVLTHEKIFDRNEKKKKNIFPDAIANFHLSSICLTFTKRIFTNFRIKKNGQNQFSCSVFFFFLVRCGQKCNIFSIDQYAVTTESFAFGVTSRSKPNE